MKNLSLKLVSLFAIAILTGTLMAFIIPQDQKKGAKWDIPEKYHNMTNPYKDNVNLKMGKMLYSKHCKSCHGSKGLGDGSKAAQLKTFPGDFTTDEFQAYTDGDLYYMVTVGRDEMESYSKKIPDDEDMWAVISYLRTFKK